MADNINRASNRAAEKARSRERDEERLRNGEISAVELQRENCVFRNVRKDIVHIRPKHLPPGIQFLTMSSKDE
ncbi:MAG: hypothetical protein CFE32_05710 [Alphaproteobacteria bacterium PA3]|nr:MAG: hypothetical protein CFE32_05710 [Alphaproteobacteria bacterium PA3]